MRWRRHVCGLYGSIYIYLYKFRWRRLNIKAKNTLKDFKYAIYSRAETNLVFNSLWFIKKNARVIKLPFGVCILKREHKVRPDAREYYLHIQQRKRQ